MRWCWRKLLRLWHNRKLECCISWEGKVNNANSRIFVTNVFCMGSCSSKSANHPPQQLFLEIIFPFQTAFSCKLLSCITCLQFLQNCRFEQTFCKFSHIIGIATIAPLLQSAVLPPSLIVFLMLWCPPFLGYTWKHVFLVQCVKS